MVKTTKTLRLNFKNAQNKSTAITLTNAIENLPADKVKEAMQKISDSEVFAKDGTPLYAVPVGASYIERTVTPVFDDSEAVKSAKTADAE